MSTGALLASGVVCGASVHTKPGSVALSVVAGCADVSRSVVIDVTELVGTVFSGLSALVIDDVEDVGDVICVRARTRHGAVACPGCGAGTARVHEYHERTAADVPVDGRRVLVLCVPKTSSTSCDQAIFADQPTDASLSSDAALTEIDRLG